MALVQVKLIEQVSTPKKKRESITKHTDTLVSIEKHNNPSWSWADIEEVLSAEWEIGGLAMPTDAIRALVAGE